MQEMRGPAGVMRDERKERGERTMGTRGSVGGLVAAVLASSASAAVTGLDAQYNGFIGGRHVWSLYAVSSDTSHVLLNVLHHTVLSGSMASIEHNDVGGGSWNPALTLLPEQIANDSFVTITGQPGGGTNLDPGFGTGAGPVIPSGAGWLTANPGAPILFTGGRIKIMQLAGSALVPGHFPYLARLTIGYKANVNSTTPLFAENLTYGPAPGAVALLALGGLARQRRRRL